jgi:beta-galactosidase GanA
MNGLRKVIACLLFTLLAAAIPAVAQAGDTPHIVEKQGRHALIVDGAPFLMLGAQANNSSAWPSALPRVWPAMEALNVNTVEMPVAWEQIEPQEGHFDFTVVDTLLEQARARNLRLVLLWFATWKNTNPQYAPRWVKLDNRRFPRMVREDGTFHYALSPFGGETLKADSKAFAALMHHLREVDPQNTVIMMQVENEAGSYGLARDHAPVAEAAFKAPVPAALRARLHKPAGSWAELFGRDAELYFHAWQVARYIDAVAAAGKAEKPLPMYVNAALPGDPFTWQDAKTYASGGPANTVIDVYKAAAPHLDLVAPDIYNPAHRAYVGFLSAYDRPDNALFVPETGHGLDYARFFFEAMGRGAIGWSPFGMDYTRYAPVFPATPSLEGKPMVPFAANYALFRPIARLWARLAFEGQTWGVAEPEDPVDGHRSVLKLGRYTATVSFGSGDFGNAPPKGNTSPSGGVAIARLGEDEYLVTGYFARVAFDLIDHDAGNLIIDRVEEGTYDAQGHWQFARVWNGDQVDWGLNFTGAPQMLRVKLATYPKN